MESGTTRAEGRTMPKILVIDDDPLVRNTILRILRSSGFEVLSADDGVRGMKAFRSETPDLVITDIIMPEQEGIQTIMQMRRERPDAKIIAISGGGRIGNADFLSMARSLGADDIVSKPFTPAQLVSRVTECLASA
jgi:two-component system, chemotaxis family, chemotaxis protein CheY